MLKNLRTPLNDWPIKRCLTVSVGLLVIMLGLIELAGLGFDIPVLRQIVGFVFLSFVPGMLILRILKIHNAGAIESLLYSVGFSLIFIMATGVIANFALPPLGVSRPISLMPLTATFAVLFLMLCLLAYMRDKGFHPTNPLPKDNKKGEATPILKPILLAVLLPLLAVLGASLVNTHQSNILLFALIFIVIIVIGLAAFNKFIPPRVYPFMIFMMAVALIYQTTLISGNLVGSDIHFEHYAANLVLESGHWNATTAFTVNSCLSIVVLAPVYSLLLNMDIVWLFKAVYPLLFCLVPLGLFQILRLQIKPHYAFLAAFFFISLPMFSMDMAQLARQQVSEFFFILVILLMVDRKLALMQRIALVLVFGFGVVVSHYGLGTGYIGYLVLGALLLVVIKSRPIRMLWQWLVGKTQPLPSDLTSTGAFNKKALIAVIGISLIFTFGYYNAVASGAALRGANVAIEIAQGTGDQVAHGITTTPPADTIAQPNGTPPTPESPSFIKDILARFPMLDPLLKEPLVQTALGLDFPSASLGGKIWRILQYLVELCLVVGFFRMVFRPKAFSKLKIEYIALTMVSVLVLLGVFVFPSKSYGMGATRIWQITLLFMIPWFLFGGEAIAQGIMRISRIIRRGFASSRLNPNSLASLRLLAVALLIPYFIFNSGIVFELGRSQIAGFIDMPYSIALSGHRVDLNTVFTKQSIVAADWLTQTADGSLVYADVHGINAFADRYENHPKMDLIPTDIKRIASPSFIYFRAWNIKREMLTFPTAYAARQSVGFDDIQGLNELIESGNRIYNNGAQVLIIDE